MKNFYTAQEAQARLGMTKSAFHYLVRKGTLKKIVPPGKKQGMYPKVEIDNFAAQLKAMMDAYERDSSVFAPATMDDLQTEYEIDLLLYGPRGSTPLERRQERLAIVPNGNYVLRSSGEIVGHVGFFPVEREYLLMLVNAQVSGIPPEKVQPFTPGIPLSVFFSIVSVKPGFPPEIEKHFGLRLIAGAANVFKHLGEQGVLIEDIYATSRTPQGIRLCRKLGMEEAPTGDEPGRFRFRLHIETSTSLLVQEYKAGYTEHLKEHETMHGGE